MADMPKEKVLPGPQGERQSMYIESPCDVTLFGGELSASI